MMLKYILVMSDLSTVYKHQESLYWLKIYYRTVILLNIGYFCHVMHMIIHISRSSVAVAWAPLVWYWQGTCQSTAQAVAFLKSSISYILCYIFKRCNIRHQVAYNVRYGAPQINIPKSLLVTPCIETLQFVYTGVCMS